MRLGRGAGGLRRHGRRRTTTSTCTGSPTPTACVAKQQRPPRPRAAASRSRPRGWPAWLDDELLSNTVFGALYRGRRRAPPRWSPGSTGSPGGRCRERPYSDVAHRVFTSPAPGASSARWSTPCRARSALEALREAARVDRRLRLAHQLPRRDPRPRRADDVPLSTAHGPRLALPGLPRADATPTTAAYFGGRRADAARPRRPPALGQGAHPHRGRPGAGLPPLRRRSSPCVTGSTPTGVFANAYLRRVLGD